jgi:hypothetical protein
MKKNKILLIVFLSVHTLILNGQKNIEELSFDDLKNKELVTNFIWGDYNSLEDFDLVPESYLNESAVILKKERYYSYKCTLPATTYNKTVLRRRYLYREIVKIQDANGVDYYSTLSIDNYNEKKDQIGIRLIKPDGRIIIIDNDRLIIEEAEIETTVKVSVPNIEIGDIIDFYRFDNSKTKFDAAFKIYNSEYLLLVDEFPIVHQYIEFTFFKNSYMIYSLLNNDLEPIISEKTNDYKKKVVFENNMTDKYGIDERWVYDLRVFPSLRFQLGVGSRGVNIYNYFFDSDEIVTLNRSENELENNLLSYFVLSKPDYTRKKILNESLKEIEKHFKGKTVSKMEKAEYAYNYFRYNNYNTLSTYFGFYLREEYIKFDIYNYIPRWYGDFNQILDKNELQFGIKTKIGDKAFYITNVSKNTMMGDTPDYFDGVDAITTGVVYQKAKAKAKVNDIILPVSSSDKNVSFTENKFTISDKTLEVKSVYKLTGKAKSNYQRYFPNTISKFENTKYLELKISKKDRIELDLNYEKLILMNLLDTINDSEIVMGYKDFFKYSILSNYDEKACEGLEMINLKNSGRYLAHPALEYSASYKLTGYIKKMGNDYILSIGKLIGGQVNISDEERDRTIPAFQDYNREFVNEMTFAIPDGYSVEGLEQIRYNVDNKTGSYVSTADIIGNQLIVKTHKAYKQLVVSPEDWHLVLEFLDAAFDFSEQKILFKKG